YAARSQSPCGARPVNTIANHAITAAAAATAPRRPAPPAQVAWSWPAAGRQGQVSTAATGAPTRIMCGSPRKNRNSVVRRLRFDRAGSTWSSTGKAGMVMLVRHGGVEFRRAHANYADRAFFGIGEAVRHKGVEALAAGLAVEHGLEHRAAARRYRVRLDAGQGMRRIAIGVDAIEDGADDVKVARRVGSGVEDEEADAIADVDLEWGALVLEGVAIEDDVARVVGEGRRPVGVRPFAIELALHDHELFVRRGGPAAAGIDDDREIHALHEVHEDGRRTAMHHERAGVPRDEAERDRVVRQDHTVGDIGGNARGVEVDRVRDRRLVYHADPNLVADADPEDRSRDRATEGPRVILHA